VSPTRVAGLAAVLVVALAMQVSVLPRFPLPGPVPDLVLVFVLAVALVTSPGAGAVAGFAAGLALDLVPPADHAAGRWAFVLCLTGYLAGQLAGEARRSAVVPLAVAGLAALFVPLGFALSGVFLGDPRSDPGVLVALLLGELIYVLLLTPFAVPAMARLVRSDSREVLLP
jgi:rod shape-determining protein MreD